MRRRRAPQFVLAAQLFWLSAAFGQGGYKIEAIGAPPSSDIPKAFQESLEPQGARLVNEQGAAVCEVWLRKQILTKQSAPASADILYGSLDTGTLLGVLRFPNAGSDFRAQAIQPGFYTLRYALIPQDGNHMGVNPYRDSLLLSPISSDTELDKQLKFDDLVKLSRQSSGASHPAFLIMSPVSEGQNSPAVVKDHQGHWSLQVKLHGQGGDFPIAIVLVGKWEG